MSPNSPDDWRWSVPEYFNIGVACTDAHLGTPIAARTAMIVEDDRAGTSSATFAELADASSRFAQLLRDLGVALGERVLIRLPNSLAYPVAFLGAMKRGAIAVPTSTLLVAEEVRYLAQDSAAAVLVTHKAMWPDLEPALRDMPGLRHVVLAGAGPLPAATAAESGGKSRRPETGESLPSDAMRSNRSRHHGAGFPEVRGAKRAVLAA